MTSAATKPVHAPLSAKDNNVKRARGRKLAALGFALPILIYLIVFYLFPLVQNLLISVHRYDRSTFVHGGAPFVGLDIYGELFADGKIYRVFAQTAIFVFVSIFFQYLIGLGLALFFQRNFPLSATLRGIMLVPWLLPVIVSGTVWQWMMNPDDGILNQFLNVFGIDGIWWLNAENAIWAVIIANIWLGIPFNLVILYSGLQNIPTELYEAAAIDGASSFQRFRMITLPLLKPVSLITLLLGLIYTLKVVDIIWIMTMGVGSSETLATWAYGMAFGKGISSSIRYSEASAVGTILLLIAFAFGILYVFLQRQGEKS